jgi:Mn2+/Fe2+ NRAMP family transporter
VAATTSDPATDEAHRSPVTRFLDVLGPRLVTGASDDDPSGVATYAQAGATFGNGMLWTVPVTLPLMIAVQEICDRTALATGKSLGTLARAKFGTKAMAVTVVLLVALIGANTLNLAADLMAIGQGMHLLHAGPAPLWAALAGGGIALTVTLGSFGTIERVFKWLCMALLAYVVVLFAVQVDWADVTRGLTAQHFELKPAYLSLVVAVLGTSISPYSVLLAERSPHRRAARGGPCGG